MPRPDGQKNMPHIDSKLPMRTSIPSSRCGIALCLCMASLAGLPAATAALTPRVQSPAPPPPNRPAPVATRDRLLPGRSLLDTSGNLLRRVDEREVASWKQELHTMALDRERAGWLHVWLGEWELGANQQPGMAIHHFREAERLARRTESLAGRAALDEAIALDFEGAYVPATEAFHRLLMPQSALPGYDGRSIALWYAHASACAGYHAERAKLGIKEPPRLDPLCGAASLAACLRALGAPYDKKTVLSACRVTGEGSTLEDVAAAGKKLGMSVFKISADEIGLRYLAKPLVAYVEHDHFIAVVGADKAGVSYLCSDCGAWPGGRNTLTWKQWRAMDCGVYLAVARKGSATSAALASLPPLGQGTPGVITPKTSLRFHRAFGRRQSPLRFMARHASLIQSILLLSCGGKPKTTQCPPYQCPPTDSGGGGASGSQGGDPVNLATGQEEYAPADDLVVYNPVGPPVRWGRRYDSLRQVGDSYGHDIADPQYQCNDFGVGWSHHYNIGVYDASSGGVGDKYIVYENGATTHFYAPDYPNSHNNFRVTCLVDPGAPVAVTWTANGYSIIFGSDRTTWFCTQTPFSGIAQCPISQLTDRNGHSLYFGYTSPAVGSAWPLLNTIQNDAGTVLLNIQRSQDGTGNITYVSDAYGRSVYYHVRNYLNYAVTTHSVVPSYQELERVSQITQSGSKPADRYVYGYQILQNQNQWTEEVRFLHTITVPSPTGSGTSTATINYNPSTCTVNSLVDANGNVRSYTYGYSGSSNTTAVTVKNSKGVTAYSYQATFDSSLNEVSRTNGNGAGFPLYTRQFGGTDPFRPSSVTDGNGNTTIYSWDYIGEILSIQKPSPRNTVTNFTYNYPFQPTSVTEGAKSPTTFSYDFNSGLLTQMNVPPPGTTGSNSTVAYSLTWDGLGNPLTVTTPGNNAASSIVTTFDYGPTSQVGEPLTITDNLGKTIGLTYDPLGRIASYADQVGNTTGISYNLSGQPILITYPSTTGPTGTVGSSTQAFAYLYDGGPLDSVTTYDEGGKQLRQVVYKYGKEGELLSRTGSTEPVTYTYDALYRVLTLADGAAHKTTYTYNTAGYLASIKYPKGDLLKYTAYDVLGNVKTRVDGRGITTNYVYNDPENLLTNINYPVDPGHNVTFGYDAYSRRSGMTDGTGSQAIGYDDNDMVTGVQTTYTGLSAQTIAYSYYPDGSRQGMSTPAGNFAYQYDGNGVLHSLTNPFNETTTWNPTDNRLVGKVTLPNGVTSAYSYDARNRVSSLLNATSGGATLSSFTNLLNDAANNRTSLTANDGTTTYSYDNKDELIKEQSTRAGGYTDSFAYDTAGNPTTFRGAANTFNTDNQFANSGNVYDGAGNPTTYQGTSLAFDQENRLLGAGTLTADYRGDGLRAWKQGATGKVHFLYDASFLICELDASGNLQAVNTAYGDRVVSRRTTTSTFYTFDPQGNVAQKLDVSGNVVSSSVYDGFGAAKAGGTSGDPFGFRAQFGYYTDIETGLQLLTYRYYGSSNGRFLTRDPISYAGGINLYAYTRNRPTLFVDTLGLDPQSGPRCWSGPPGSTCDSVGGEGNGKPSWSDVGGEIFCKIPGLSYLCKKIGGWVGGKIGGWIGGWFDYNPPPNSEWGGTLGPNSGLPSANNPGDWLTVPVIDLNPTMCTPLNPNGEPPPTIGS